MDPASLTIGATGLVIQLHSVVLGCLEGIRNFRDAGEQNALLNCKVQVEQYILARWGDRCGLATGTFHHVLPRKEDQEMALMILKNMLSIVAEVETLKKRYGMSYVVASNVDSSVKGQKSLSFLLELQKKQPMAKASIFGSTLSRTSLADEDPNPTKDERAMYETMIQSGKTAMDTFRKYRWVVSDSRRFEEMIRHLQDFNKSLYMLAQHVIPIAVVEGDILDATPDQYLDIMEKATAESHPMISFATGFRRTVTVLESPSPLGAAGILSSNRNLRINLQQLNIRTDPRSSKQSRALATYRPSHGRTRTVLVEWRQLESGLTPLTRDATITQAENLAKILQKKPAKAAREYVRILECLGFFVTDDRVERVGYVFDLPSGADTSMNPVTLEELLQEDEDSDKHMNSPPLEQRFALCKSICNCIYWLHAAGLVHKGIRSNNILFFQREGGRMDTITEPYITGFDHSRPDGPNDPTITISVISPDDNRYRHPDASSSLSKKSTKIHDMYSLGLVLLEIATWWKLKSLVSDAEGEDLPSYLLGKESPIEELDHRVGTRFQSVVYRCVRGDFGVNLDDENGSRTLRDVFLLDIAAEVMKCSV